MKLDVVNTHEESNFEYLILLDDPIFVMNAGPCFVIRDLAVCIRLFSSPHKHPLYAAIAAS
jgi:hypothetical protein